MLSYHRDDKAWTVPINRAYVLSVEFCEDKTFGLSIRLDSGRQLNVQAESADERKAWFDMLELSIRIE